MLQFGILFLITLCTMLAFSGLIIYVRNRSHRGNKVLGDGGQRHEGCCCEMHGAPKNSSEFPMYRP